MTPATARTTSRHRRSSSQTLGRLALAVALASIVAVAAFFVVRVTGSGASLKSELEDEFAGAYPAEPVGGGQLIDIELVAAPATIEIIDDQPTDVWAYNGTVPGPALRATLGDTLRITVRNDLPASTTIHWHGIRVPNNMDGVPGVNQKHIEPGDTFIYEFTPPDPGTYWYHSHTNGSEQLERGLYGSIIIDEPATSDLDNYAQDVVWVIDDWLLTEDAQLDPDFNTSADRTHNGRWGNVITVNATLGETLEAQPGERIRLRLVNASNGRAYTLDFGELEANLVAVDGLTVGKVGDAAGLVLAPGNRADVDITLPTTPGTYVVNDTFVGTPQPLATIVVQGETAADSSFAPTTNDDVPDWAAAAEAEVDHELTFETSNRDGEWIWTINGEIFGEHTPIDVTEGEFTKIKLTNQTHPMHPIHLHGQFFKVLTRNGEPVDEPYFRDTVLLNMLDEVEIGMVPLDVGDWVLHCHIQEHAEAGMMTVMTVTPAAT